MIADIYYMTMAGRNADPMSFVHAKPSISDIEHGKREHYVKVDQINIETDSSLTHSFAMAKASEELFSLYNGASKKPNPLSTPEKQEQLKKLSVGHTSMSVGDFVVFGETKERIYVVDSMGFKKVEPTDAWFESLYFPAKPGEA